MPVTLITANHPPHQWEEPKLSRPNALFKGACHTQHAQSKNLIQSSLNQDDFDDSHISSSTNGFVWAVFHAYSKHHNLILRPEDVWFTILTQLSFFINAHAEELHHLFVAHEGREVLEVYSNEPFKTADFGEMAFCMTNLIEKNVIDKELGEWIIPAFTTTTDSDKVVAAILMMGATQKYFSYIFHLRCGIPSVTLLGERKDWALLSTKLEKLRQLGDEPTKFADLLQPILGRFLASFDNPEADDIRSFWGRCSHRESGGSGPTYLSGWITAFCFWNEDGKLLLQDPIPSSSNHFELRNTEPDLHAVLSNRIETKYVPSCYATVPVKVVDHSDNDRVYDTVVLAGLLGIQATPSGASLAESRYSANPDPSASTEKTGLDSIQPLSAWFMYEKRQKEAPKIKETPPPECLSLSFWRAPV